MLSNMSEIPQKPPSAPAAALSANGDDESSRIFTEAIPLPFFVVDFAGLAAGGARNRSHAVDQDIQRTFQRIAMNGEGSDGLAQLSTRDGGKFLNPHNPHSPVERDGGRQTRKSCIAVFLTQGRDNARRRNADQIGLQIDNKLAATQPVKVKLRHASRGLEASELRKRQSVSSNLFGIGRDSFPVFRTPQTIAFDLCGASNRCFGKSRHVEAKRTGGFRHFRIQRQIYLDPSHQSLLEYTYG